MKYLLALLLVAGCRKAPEPPPERGAVPFVAGDDTCGKALNHVVKLQSDMMLGLPAEEQAKVTRMMNTVGATMAASCRATQWSGEATSCLLAIKNVQEAASCDAQLTPAQKTARDTAATAAVDELER